MANGDAIKTSHLKLIWAGILAVMTVGAVWSELSYFPLRDGIVLAENFKTINKQVGELTKSNKEVNESLRELVNEMKIQRAEDTLRRELREREKSARAYRGPREGTGQ